MGYIKRGEMPHSNREGLTGFRRFAARRVASSKAIPETWGSRQQTREGWDELVNRCRGRRGARYVVRKINAKDGDLLTSSKRCEVRVCDASDVFQQGTKSADITHPSRPLLMIHVFLRRPSGVER